LSFLSFFVFLLKFERSMLQQFLSSGNLFLEREESVVLSFAESECVAGLSGEERPRVTMALSAELAHDEAALERFVRRLVFSSLLVNLNERKVLLCFGVTASDVLRSALCRILVKLRCPGVAFAANAVAALIPLGLRSGLVIEMADGSTVCVAPVTDGGVALGSVQIEQLEDVERAVSRAISASPVDLRLELVQHVVVLGNKLKKHVSLESIKGAVPDGLKPHVNLVKSPFENLAWIGGSIIGSTLHKKSAGVPVLKGEELKLI
jgi:actin-related protein